MKIFSKKRADQKIGSILYNITVDFLSVVCQKDLIYLLIIVTVPCI
jgi:hypothetical protein